MNKTMSNRVNGMMTFSQLTLEGDTIVKIVCALSISTLNYLTVNQTISQT